LTIFRIYALHTSTVVQLEKSCLIKAAIFFPYLPAQQCLFKIYTLLFYAWFHILLVGLTLQQFSMKSFSLHV